MFIFCNILLIAIVGFIAYWWANQGLFSALLHLMCVIVAGAIALAFWEPLAMVLLGVRGLDDYSWAVSLVVPFAVSLIILRLLMDRLAPANAHVPHSVSLAFGGVLGAAAGALTMGIFVIGAGHVQSDRSVLLGFQGWGRSGAHGGRIVERQRLWIPVHRFASDFYGLLSVSSLSTDRPLLHYNPDLDRQATLLRDGFNKGRSKLSLKPSAATVERLYFTNLGGTDRYLVEVSFGAAALDAGQQLTLSASQVRLIGRPQGDRAKAPTVHPVAWRQWSGYHRFDDLTHHVTSQSGQESTEVIFQFDVPDGFEPRFVQIRGTRYRVPDEARPAPEQLAALVLGGEDATVAPAEITGGSIDSVIRISNDIRPVSISTNSLPGTINEQDKYLTAGKATFTSGGFVNRQLKILGILEPEGTRVVRLDVSRGGPADIFRYQGQAGGDGKLALVDVAGNEYTPVGFFHEHSGGVTIMLEPTLRVRSMEDLPALPTAGSQKLELIFYITQGVTITGFRFGDVDVGTCSFKVE